MRRLIALLVLLLLPFAAQAASPIPSLPTIGSNGSVYPLPDATLNPQWVWMTQQVSGVDTDFKISPFKLGAIYVNSSAPATPFQYQLWWNTGASPVQLEYYTGTIWSPVANAVGAGTVSGPTTSTAQDAVVWCNNTGTQICDSSGAFPLSFGSTPTDIVNINIGNYPLVNELPAGVLQAFKCAEIVPSTYTAVINPNTCISSYIVNNNPNGNTGAAAVGIYSQAMEGAASSSVWALNSVTTNEYPLSFVPNTGLDCGLCVGYEIDMNINKKSGGVQPGGQADALIINGASQAGVQPTLDSFGVHVYGMSSQGLSPFSFAFDTEAGAAVVALQAGPAAPGNSQNSQFINFAYTNIVGAMQQMTLQALTSNALAISATTINLANGVVIGTDSTGKTNELWDYAGNAAVLAGASPGTAQNSYRNVTHLFQTINGAANLAQIDATGLFIGNNGNALSTSATGPFIYVGAGAGTPTGVPTDAAAGRSSLYNDSTDHKLCWYEQANTAWKCVTGS